MSHDDKVEIAKSAGDIVVGVVATGIVLGWVHLAVGVVTVIYTLARLWGFIEKRKLARAEVARSKKEKEFYVIALAAHYKQPIDNFDFLPVDELRHQYNETKGSQNGH